MWIPDDLYAELYGRFAPRACVDVVVRSQRGGIVLVRRKIEPQRGLWHTPGGAVLKGESLEAAARRHAKKEIGVELGECKPVGAWEFLSEPYSAGGREFDMHSISVVMLAEVDECVLHASSEGADPTWFFSAPATHQHPVHVPALIKMGYLQGG